ncbi:MAG: VWA domain-containing protein [Oscillospiraceae bacterium]|nr:VWA domain-containing protein [Oscillospiraceae bacterium]
MSDYIRRLPVYLLLDTSGSMTGDPIEAVRQGVKALVSELRGDPQALETAYLSVITFASTAQQVSSLTELMLFKEPQLNAGGSTALGAALKLLTDCIDRELRRSTSEQKGDWKPLVFLLTDGAPTDEWREAAAKLKSTNPANIIACAAGAYADTAVLKEITDNVLLMNSLSAGDMAQFFAWVSSSVKVSSKNIDAMPGQAIELPPPPQGFIVVP